MQNLKFEPQNLLTMSNSWWEVRAMVIAWDKDKQIGPVSLKKRIELRKN